MSIANDHLWQVLGLFVVSLFLFHLWVFIDKPSSKTLKKIDYVWLSFAAISLVSLSSAGRIEEANIILYYYKPQLVTAARNLTAAGQSAQAYACKEWLPPPPGNTEGQERYDSRGKACDWYTRFALDLKQHEGDIQYLVKVTTKEKLDGAPRYWQYEPLRLYADLADYVLETYSRAEKKSKKSIFEIILVWISPYLLAFALALRIAKVTGELRL